MAGTRNTNSILTETDGTNKTSTHLSTNIVVKIDNYIVGAIQTLSINEKRQVKMIDELGTDGHIDSVPTKSADVTGQCTRIRFAKQRMAEALGRGYVHIASQRLPFDIEIHDFFHTTDKVNSIITTIKNAWMTSIDYEYQAENWIIMDKMSFEAETIYSKVTGGNGNVVQGAVNGQGGPIILNQYEQEADRGEFRGAMDAAGILTAFVTDPFQLA